jgi:hypothetical protein
MLVVEAPAKNSLYEKAFVDYYDAVANNGGRAGLQILSHVEYIIAR